MKTRKELNVLKEEVKATSMKLAELTEEELGFVVGGGWHLSRAKPIYPDLSMVTVYRNLKEMKEDRIISSVAVVKDREGRI